MEEAKAKRIDDEALAGFIEGMKKCLAEASAPCSSGLDGLAVEFADTVGAVRSGIGKRICRQCISLAAECLRLYASERQKEEQVKSVPT